ncbi:hypothetical protein ACOMHN_033257 [Nucella lapillus]
MSSFVRETLTRLAQQLRQKTTSEHVLGLRGGTSGSVAHRSQNQIAKDTMSHMDFLPVPEGSWQEFHQARSNKRNIMLICSTSLLAFTVYCMYMTDCFFMHTLPSRRKIKPDSDVIGKIRPMDSE